MTPPAIEIISSAQNPRVQLTRALIDQPKARRKHNLFVAEGARLVEEGLNTAFPLHFLLYKATHTDRVDDLLGRLGPGSPAFLLEDQLFDQISDTESSQGVLAVFSIPEPVLPEPLNLVLILDQLRDPGNLGTILRSAEAAGAQVVCLPPGTTDPWAPKVVRSGMGAHFRLPLLSWTWDAIAALTEGLPVYHADMAGESSYWQVDFTAPCAILIGGEAEGISPAGKQLATRTVRIPMIGQNESLNAAISASLLLFEVLRQRFGKRL